MPDNIVKTEKSQTKLLHKLVLFYTLVFCSILLVVMTAVFFILSYSREQQAELTNQIFVNQPLKLMEAFLDDMDNTASLLMTNEALISKFRHINNDSSTANYFDHNLLEAIDTVNVLDAINRQSNPLSRISIYNDKGDFVSSGIITDIRSVTEKLSDPSIGEKMNMFKEPGNNMILRATSKDEWSNYFNSNYITITRPIMNVYSRDVVGLVEVQQSADKMAELLTTDDAHSIEVHDDDGQTVFKNFTDSDQLVASIVSAKYGWKIDLYESSATGERGIILLIVILAGAFLVISLIVYAAINIIAREMVKPIAQLTKSVKEISVTAPENVRIQTGGIEEVEELENAFNQMMDKLILSVGQEKKASLLAMQAQMNPHFLYNVLSVLYAMAIEGKNDKVMDICENLSGMLRYAASYSNGTATLREDMEQARAYLELMKARYDFMFEYKIDIDPDCMDIQVPKMILQPLCENSFVHAFENMEPPYRLSLSVKSDSQGGFTICVQDNGSGFDEAERRSILNKTNEADYHDLRQINIGGLGLVSTVVRLKLHTHMRVICNMRSAKNCDDTDGTVVEISVLMDKDN